MSSVKRTHSSGRRSSSGKKHIPTPPPLPSTRLSKSTIKGKNRESVIHHAGPTIAYDGFGQVNWLKDVSTGKIYTEYANGPLTLSRAEIKEIEAKNDKILGRKRGGKRSGKSRRNKTRKHRRKS